MTFSITRTLHRIISLRSRQYYLSELRRNQWKRKDELEKIQLKRLRTILGHAYKYVPYYHRLFKSVKFKPEEIKDLDDLRRIPITNKLDVKKHFSDFLVKGTDQSKYRSVWTSGSTGIPLKLLYDRNSQLYQGTLLLYNFLECGVRLTDKLFSIYASGAGQPIVVEPRLRKLNFFLLRLNEVVVDPRLSIKEIANTLNQNRPDVIYGFPSFIEELCALVTLEVNPRFVFSHGGKLTERCRKIVESTFEAEVYDTYGSAEFWRLAFECDEHSGLHMITDCAVVECVRDGEVVAVGESGDVVVTGLSNYLMPLIRYELGDIAVLADESCACGRSWPLVRDIQGRTMDSFTLPSGRVLSVATIFQWVYPEIKDYVYCFSQYQIVQESPNKIVLRIVKGREYRDEIVDQITRRIKKDLEGEDVTFSLEIVDEIPREKSGKRQQIVSYANRTLPKT